MIIPWAIQTDPPKRGSVLLPGTSPVVVMEHLFSASEAALNVSEIMIYLTYNISDVPNAMELLPEVDRQKTMRLWAECDLIAQVDASDELTIEPTHHDDFMMITVGLTFDVSAYTAALTDTARFEWFVVSNATDGVPFFVSMWSMQGAGGGFLNFTTPFCDGTLPPTDCLNCQSTSRSRSSSMSLSMSPSDSLTQSQSSSVSQSESLSASSTHSNSVSISVSLFFCSTSILYSTIPYSLLLFYYHPLDGADFPSLFSGELLGYSHY
jgi:hypothetical protein